MTSYSRPCVSEREEGIAGTNHSQCNPSSSPSAGLGPNATKWYMKQSRKRAKSSSGAGATSLLRRRDISRIRPCWAPPLPPAVGPSSWGPTGRYMGSTPRRGDFTGREAPVPALLPGARVVGLIWKLPRLRPFGKYDTKGVGVIVYACMLCALTFIFRDTRRFHRRQGIEDALNNTHSGRAMLVMLLISVLCLDRAIIILTRNSPTDFTFIRCFGVRFIGTWFVIPLRLPNQCALCRSNLQRFRHSLHVPLRLDIYYQYEEVVSDPNNDNSGGAGSASRHLKLIKPRRNATSSNDGASITCHRPIRPRLRRC